MREKFAGDFGGEVGEPNTPQQDLVAPDLNAVVIDFTPIKEGALLK